MPADQHNPIEAVLFDLDGTLLDTARDLANALNLLLVREGKTKRSFNDIRKVVSNGGNAMISLGFNTRIGEPEHTRLYHELLHNYGNDVAHHTCPFAGIEALLTHIDSMGLPWGVVTNKPRPFSEPLLNTINLQPAYAALVCPDDVSHRKPHPEPMYLACKILNCHPENTLYVGDHRRDIEAGRNAGMITVAALYGYVDDNEDTNSWQADYTIQQPDELIALLSTLN